MRQPREHEIQAAIVDALRLAGLTVFETTAYRQKGPSGVDRAIPDLLVSVDIMPRCYIGIEVKTDVTKPKWSSPEQEQAFKEGRFFLADDPDEALIGVELWLRAYCYDEERWAVYERIDKVRLALAGGAHV